MDSDEILRTELERVHAECERLQQENAELRLRLSDPLAGVNQVAPTPSSIYSKKAQSLATVTADSWPEIKVSLFRSLFRGRDDVYAVRWEGKNGRTGYSPAGIREWPGAAAQGKKRSVKHGKLFPLPEEVIRDHLLGRQMQLELNDP